MTTTYLIALSNGLATAPETKCFYCNNDCIEKFMDKWLCYVHVVIYERMEE